MFVTQQDLTSKKQYREELNSAILAFLKEVVTNGKDFTILGDGNKLGYLKLSLSGTDLKSDGNEVAVESIEIAHEGIQINNN